MPNRYKMTTKEETEVVDVIAVKFAKILERECVGVPGCLAIAAMTKVMFALMAGEDDDFDDLVRGLLVSIQTNAEVWKAEYKL